MRFVEFPMKLRPVNSMLEDMGIDTGEEWNGHVMIDLDKVVAFHEDTDTATGVYTLGETFAIEIPYNEFKKYFTND
jgi:hypothetical protein